MMLTWTCPGRKFQRSGSTRQKSEAAERVRSSLAANTSLVMYRQLPRNDVVLLVEVVFSWVPLPHGARVTAIKHFLIL
ncbi:hypothetical protein BC937DRAFT_88793 [Endogone sp. FLAS-F59071]|nr:hypothetical protein BC937DRAFT_88793 [Endogone sp. FLAS-F59071]|eukprot:RUS18423.1 hypothetical protein BC937DRAFT_88793 [Endogone sp. FLAS-F59071]